jgi:drug/metabolite transporter (DMT)-like permease
VKAKVAEGCTFATFAILELPFLGEWVGVLIAVVSSSLGGTAAAVTRYLVGSADPITLAILRWGIGLLCLWPTALLLRVRWPQRSDWMAVIALGLCFFGLFFVLYNIAMSYRIAGIYLGVGGGALAFILWVLALERATPTRVANTMTLNPIAAGLLATQLVGEPITLNLVIGLIAVFIGIWIATTEGGKA